MGFFELSVSTFSATSLSDIFGLLSNNGTSNKDKTLSTLLKEEISLTIFFISWIEDSDKSSFFGEKVTIKKSLDPYFSVFSLKSFKSGSFSKRRVSDDASSLKLETPKTKKKAKQNNKNKFFLGFEDIKLAKVIFDFLLIFVFDE